MTQFIAWRLGYHPALGHPLLGHWYAPWSWIEWYNAPWAINVRETLRLALAGGIVAGMLTAMAAIYIQNAARRRPVKHPGIHGTARFMTPDEVRKSGLLHDGSAAPGVYVGAWTDETGTVRYLRHVGPEHCIIIAPTRSGKGVGVIVPTLLSWAESVLVYDEKGELWQLSAGWRSQYVGRAIRWEPGAFDGSAGFNFLEEIPLSTPYEVAEAQNIAQIICDPRGDGIEGKDHWGKAQPLDAMVLTPTGFRRMGDLRIGDLVTSPDGRTSSITGVYPQGTKEIYRITFEDGRSAECCNDHLWKVWRHGTVFESGRTHETRKAIAHGKWVVEPLSVIRKWISENGRKAYHAAVPLIEPNAVELPAKSLPISPYVLGAILGDGSFPSKARPRSVMFTSIDAEILERLSVELPEYEVCCTGTNRGLDYRLVQKQRRRQGLLHKALTEFGLLGCKAEEKFIPVEYKTSSLAQRLALVQGLMDTDGWVNEGTHAGFTSVSERLAKDLRDVLWSLGARVKLIKQQKFYIYKEERCLGRPSFRLTIVHPNVSSLFSLPRKVAQCRPKMVNHNLRIKSIELVGTKPAQCIAVDHPDRLYITDDFIVTHNTSFDLLASVILHVMYVKRDKGETASLTDVAFALSDPEEKSDTLWEQMRTNKHMNGKVHPFIASAGRDQLDRPERERGSVLSSAKTYLTLVKDPIIQKNTSRSSFHIDDLMDADDPVSLYVVTRPDNNERLRPLVRLFLTMAMHKLMGVELEYKNGQPIQPHKHKLLMTIDEFPSLGRLDVISNSLSKCAGYGIKALLAAQDREQMFRAYGQYQTITPNCHVRIVYAPNETATAEWVSKMLSKQTMTVEQITESGKKYGNLNHISRTYHDVERELMTVGEIMRIRSPKKNRKGQIVEPGGMVVFVAGDFPIDGTQLLYFMDPTFSARARIPPPERIKPQGRIWRIAA